MQSKRVFISACLGMLLFGIGLITLGSVAIGLQEKFHLDKISSGTLFSILPLGILLGSLVFGPVCDRYGYKVFLVLSCFLMFIGFQGIAHAGTLCVLKICVFLFGFGGGAINGATNAVVSDISESHKAANLSLLGVFFALGALGMPLLLGILNKLYSFQSILSGVSILPVLIGTFILLTKYPEAKHSGQMSVRHSIKLIKEPLLLLIGFFLFCQSSFEGVINNWTTLYLSQQWLATESNALYGLSLFVVGMAVIRLLLGSVFRTISSAKIMMMSFIMLGIGCLIIQLAGSFAHAVIGLVVCGGGLAAGFPVMLAILGGRYAQFSGTAFGLVLTIALFGNMMMNYGMGWIAEVFGMQYYPAVLFALFTLMAVLSYGVFKKSNI
ncbi:MAG: MFS transporter [Saprospiraceae bacterium]|nr:MFS transporter [Saprospiraceae bacterium]MBK7435254.1 MFS transporter [Saprospiraceae bacterium]MBK7607766.1 MFS transporter [Saprospiraceae bacterium]MBK8510856.1 MFS transporter [Saprospiraceae bacterium]MBK8777780.1 MFS transporter [Saprospiraceae bacterium]